jgi:hypothetical protein
MPGWTLSLLIGRDHSIGTGTPRGATSAHPRALCRDVLRSPTASTPRRCVYDEPQRSLAFPLPRGPLVTPPAQLSPGPLHLASCVDPSKTDRNATSNGTVLVEKPQTLLISQMPHLLTVAKSAMAAWDVASSTIRAGLGFARSSLFNNAEEAGRPDGQSGMSLAQESQTSHVTLETPDRPTAEPEVNGEKLWGKVPCCIGCVRGESCVG